VVNDEPANELKRAQAEINQTATAQGIRTGSESAFWVSTAVFIFALLGIFSIATHNQMTLKAAGALATCIALIIATFAYASLRQMFIRNAVASAVLATTCRHCNTANSVKQVGRTQDLLAAVPRTARSSAGRIMNGGATPTPMYRNESWVDETHKIIESCECVSCNKHWSTERIVHRKTGYRSDIEG
jgi:hypothetical protein